MLLQLGSGKTAVLVERIINKVINDGVDIDKILVVTFTNAAASEMKARILEAIYKKIEEKPDDIKLQRQLTLLNKASICTIHSFCLDVIRNNFYEIDISANFRIGDTAEIEMLKGDVLEELFESKYMENNEGFIKLVETYTDYRGDEKLQDLILSIYKYIQSNPFPETWLNEKVEDFNIDTNKDFSNTKWGKVILEHVEKEIDTMILKLKNVRNEMLQFNELDKFSGVIQEDINNLEKVNLDTWEQAYNTINSVSWVKWPVDKKVTLDLKNEAKDVRDEIKKDFANLCVNYTSKEANEDILNMYKILDELRKIILQFSAKYAEAKKEKNIIDFNDIEHFALKILMKDTSEVAKNYREKFDEILIDEYQDSNLVQEQILTSISRGNNIFMVGDVKQSIYKFRQARPELFLSKYDSYCFKDDINEKSEGLKIQLFKNFRSRRNILDVTNQIFKNIMSKELGNVDYNNDEYLNFGANFPEPDEEINIGGIAELDIIDLKESDEEDEEQEDEKIENSVLEAKFVAKKIQELLNSDFKVYDKDEGYRGIKAKDICVLLRATSTLAPIYEKEISELNIPVFSDSSSTYLESMEVETIMSLLKIIDNPMQDIPLVTVLRSNIFGFSDNDLIEIRLCDKNTSFYEAMLKARLSVNMELRHKIDATIESLASWKKEEEYTPLNEFIWRLYLQTGFLNYVSLLPNGNLRQANLKMLFEKAKQYEKASFKGLFNFINFIDKIKTSSGDLSSAKIIGENDNVVRIMSIHKSKGLEFPVVFLSSTGKKFNLRDLNVPILLHQDIGIGPQYIDSEKRIEYSTLAKEAIRLAIKNETISEEMRVLYVALTRAKEKLYITGISKDVEKALKEKNKTISRLKRSDEYQINLDNMLNIKEPSLKIHENIVAKYISYLDWIELVYQYNLDRGIGNIIKLKVIDKKSIISNLKKETNEEFDSLKVIKHKAEEIKILEKTVQNIERIEKVLKWKYSFIASAKIPTKTSVTKLKDLQSNYDIQDLIEKARDNGRTLKKISAKPKFIEKIYKLDAAQKGTIMHLCLQRLDERKDYSFEDIKKFVLDLVEKKLITEVEAQSISIDRLYKYTKSELWQELRVAKEIHKEQPFYINIPARNVFDEAEENEKILVQGIIDLYYINSDDELILVDYKTDYLPDGNIAKLEEKYKVQLDIYTSALEGALGKKVKRAIICSV